MSAEKLPSAKHHDLAHTLIRTFYEALEPYLQNKGHITKDEIEKAFRLMEVYWPKVLPLFEVTCRMCTEQRDHTYKPDERRKDFLTRLVFSYLIANIPQRIDPDSNKMFPQILVHGIQANMQSMFYEKEFDALNSQAQTIFSMIGTDEDDKVWPLIAANDTLNMLADQIFVRMLLRFKHFNHQRQVFSRRVFQSVDGMSYAFNDSDFCAVFTALFGRFEGILSTQDGRVKIDLYYGEETADKMTKIFFQYNNFRGGVELSQGLRKSREKTRAGR